jgi:hypothetical protein
MPEGFPGDLPAPIENSYCARMFAAATTRRPRSGRSTLTEPSLGRRSSRGTLWRFVFGTREAERDSCEAMPRTALSLHGEPACYSGPPVSDSTYITSTLPLIDTPAAAHMSAVTNDPAGSHSPEPISRA